MKIGKSPEVPTILKKRVFVGIAKTDLIAITDMLQLEGTTTNLPLDRLKLISYAVISTVQLPSCSIVIFRLHSLGNKFPSAVSVVTAVRRMEP